MTADVKCELYIMIHIFQQRCVNDRVQPPRYFDSISELIEEICMALLCFVLVYRAPYNQIQLSSLIISIKYMQYFTLCNFPISKPNTPLYF